MAASQVVSAGINLSAEHMQLKMTRSLISYLDQYSVPDKDVSYELGNIVERFLVSMANQVNSDPFRQQNAAVIVPWARIYRLIAFEDQLVVKMLEEMKAKTIYQDDATRDAVVGGAINFINQTLQQQLSDVAATVTIEQRNDGEYIVYASGTQDEVSYKMTKRTRLILEMSNNKTLIAILMRYEALNSRGQQWGLPQAHYNYLYQQYDVRNEGFASALNSRLIGMPGANFFSLFKDLESELGSRGDFFNVAMNVFEGNWVLNPPFIESIMAEAAHKVVATLAEQQQADNNMTVFFVIPAWRTSEAYIILSTSPFMRTQHELSKNTYSYENVDGDVISANFNSVYFALSTEEGDFTEALSAGTDGEIPAERAPASPMVPAKVTPSLPTIPTIGSITTLPTIPTIGSITTTTALPTVPSTITVPTTTALPTVQTRTVEEIVAPTDESWLQSLRDFLRQLLNERATSDPAIVEQLLDPRFDKIWARCFTHQSYNRNKSENYETLETLGDKVLDTTFYDYLFARYPMIDESDASLLRNQYLGKKEQAPVSVRLGLPKHLRTAYPINKSMQEDVFEAFMGALFNVGDLALGRGTGYSLSKLFISPIYDELRISPELATKDPITQVKEIFEKLKWQPGNLIRRIEDLQGYPDSGYTMSLYWPDTAHDAFAARGIKLPTDIFGYGEGDTETEARANAYDNGFNTLNSLGIDMAYANDVSNRFKVKGRNERLHLQANALAYQQGYTEGVDFPREQFVRGEPRAVQLVGQFVGDDGNIYSNVLATVVGTPGDDFNELQRQALLQYISS